MGLRFELHDGRLTLAASDAAVRVRGLRPSVTYWIGGARHVWRPLLRATSNGFEALEGNPHGLRLQLQVAAEGAALTVHVTLHVGSEPIRLDRLAVLWLGERAGCSIGASAADWSVLRNGYQSW